MRRGTDPPRRQARRLLLAEEDGELHSYLTDFGIAKDSAASTQLTHAGEGSGRSTTSPPRCSTRAGWTPAPTSSRSARALPGAHRPCPFRGDERPEEWGQANEPAPSAASQPARSGRPGRRGHSARGEGTRPPPRVDRRHTAWRRAAATGAPTPLAEQRVAVGARPRVPPSSRAPTRPGRPGGHASRRRRRAQRPGRLAGWPRPEAADGDTAALIAVAGAGAAAAVLLVGRRRRRCRGRRRRDAGVLHGPGREARGTGNGRARSGHSARPPSRRGRGWRPWRPGALGRLTAPPKAGTRRSPGGRAAPRELSRERADSRTGCSPRRP